jgi:hypothetical protein
MATSLRARITSTYQGIGQYFFDPSGNRNEVFSGGFIYYPDNPKRVWSVDKIGKAVFYYQRELNERFMSVVDLTEGPVELSGALPHQ